MMKNKLLFPFVFALLFLTGCTEQTLYYPETSAYDHNTSVFDSAERTDTAEITGFIPEGFTYTPSDDSFNTVRQQSDNSQVIENGDSLIIKTNNMFYRLNTKTGNIIALCVDPLCEHNSYDCPFFGGPLGGPGAGFAFMGKTDQRIIYSLPIFSYDEQGKLLISDNSNSMQDTRKTRVLDLTTFQVDERKWEYWPNNSWLGAAYTTGDRDYFMDHRIDEETQTTYIALKYYDVKTKTTNILLDSEIHPLYFLHHEENKLYYCDSLSFGWLDANSGEKHPLYQGDCGGVAFDDEYYYFTKTEDSSLWRMKLDGSTPEPLGASGDAHFVLTDQYLYYRPRKYTNLGKNVQFYGQEIWRYCKASGEHELVYKFENDMGNFTFNEFTVIGNYLYGTWRYCDEELNVFSSVKWKETDYGYLLRIDMTTKEILFFDLPE